MFCADNRFNRKMLSLPEIIVLPCTPVPSSLESSPISSSSSSSLSLVHQSSSEHPTAGTSRFNMRKCLVRWGWVSFPLILRRGILKSRFVSLFLPTAAIFVAFLANRYLICFYTEKPLYCATSKSVSKDKFEKKTFASD